MKEIRIRFYITIAIVALGELLLGGAYWYLLEENITPLSKRFEEIRDAIGTAEYQADFYRRAVEPDFERNRGEFDRIRSVFFTFTNDNAREYIEFLEEQLRRNNLQKRNITLPSTANAITSVQAEGDFLDVIAFLREFENGKHLFQIETVSLTATGVSVQFSIPSL